MELNLKKGDKARIAEITGFSQVYVKKVIAGERRNKQILTLASTIVEQRAQLKASTNKRKK